MFMFKFNHLYKDMVDLLYYFNFKHQIYLRKLIHFVKMIDHNHPAIFSCMLLFIIIIMINLNLEIVNVILNEKSCFKNHLQILFYFRCDSIRFQNTYHYYYLSLSLSLSLSLFFGFFLVIYHNIMNFTVLEYFWVQFVEVGAGWVITKQNYQCYWFFLLFKWIHLYCFQEMMRFCLNLCQAYFIIKSEFDLVLIHINYLCFIYHKLQIDSIYWLIVYAVKNNL